MTGLEQRQLFEEIWGPYHEDTGAVHWKVGDGGVTKIEANKLAGPMGWYDVVFVYKGGAKEAVLPLHMMESASFLRT